VEEVCAAFGAATEEAEAVTEEAEAVTEEAEAVTEDHYRQSEGS
jgi:hypothetical protein